MDDSPNSDDDVNRLMLASAQRTIDIELRAVADLKPRIGVDFLKAANMLLNCEGRVVVTGMGKSGHIAKKIAATLASTGTLAMYVHPGEASHGDIGMIGPNDTVLALSSSGSTEEVTTLLPVIKRKSVPLIALTGAPDSALAQAADVNLDASIEEEACPLGLAPTSSTTAALVLGDALAMALLEARGFTKEEFAFSHPGGNLGRRLLLKVKDIMHTGAEVPSTSAQASIADALVEMTAKGFGLTTVIDSKGDVCGIFSDGDLRRSLDSGIDIYSSSIQTAMSRNYRHIHAEALAVEAAALMQESSVYVLIVTPQANLDSQTQKFTPAEIGIVKMHDLLKENVI